METKKHKNNFFKRNAYYLILASVLVAIIAITTVLVVTQNGNSTLNSGDNTLQKPSDSSLPITSVPSNGDSNNNQNGEENGDNGSNSGDTSGENNGNSTPNQPTQTVITFIVPVQNSTVICDYTATSVVYNKTLNVYTGHLAIDFSAEEGAEVMAVYNGVIESITTSYLSGTTITVAHGNNLKSVYNSVNAVEGLSAGMAVSQGTVIAYVSDNNRQEYKDGPHLHFEVWENGEKISPYKYLTISEK